MIKKIHDEELLFDVKDVISSKKKIILGNDLHIPHKSYLDHVNGVVDWNVESLLMALEIAMDNGVELYSIPGTIITWEVTYYCKINGQTYHVTESKKEEDGDIEYKIELV
jgi:hypothetical protein